VLVLTEEQKVREETVSVLLSEMLEEAGISNLSLLNLGGIPDIYILFGGVRLILETKEQGQRAELIRQLKDRLNHNMCEVAIGLEYPSSLVSSGLEPPTTKVVRDRLRSTTLIAMCYSHGSTEERLVFGETKVSIPSLPELLTRASSEALPYKELDIAIDKVRQSVEKFASSLKGLHESKNIADQIREVLELGE
jgi:hypothetical protein